MRVLICFFLILGTAYSQIELTIAKKPAQLKEATVEARLHGQFLIRDLSLVIS